ncbi:hypothetical protein HDU87_000477, partial [Geranomyces variabilis]
MHPLFQLSSISHNNISMNFDASFDGTQLATSPNSYGAQFSKSARQLVINYGTVFSHDDASGSGSLQLAPITPEGDTSIAFYNSTNMRAKLGSDYFRLGYVNGVFSLTNGSRIPLFSVSSEGDSSFLGQLSVTGPATFLGDMS